MSKMTTVDQLSSGEREREIDLSRTACILVVGKPVQEFAMATTERGMSDILLIV